jgi:hypothetical protein
MFSTGLCRLQTLLSQWTGRALSLAGFISAVDMVPNLVPTRFTLEHVSLRARIVILRVVVGKIGQRKLRFRGKFVPFWGGDAGITLAKMGIRDIRIQLGLGTLLEIRFAMVSAVGAEDRSLQIRLRQPDGLQVGCGPLQHGGDMRIILPVTKGLRLHDDVMFRIDQRLPIIPLDDPMGGLPFGRVVIRAMTLPLLAPLAPLRVVPREKGRDAGRLPRSALDLLMHLVRLRETLFCT